MKLIRICVVALAMVFAGCATEKSPKAKDGPRATDVIFQRFVKLNGSQHAEFSFTNTLSRSIWYLGYSTLRPYYYNQYLMDHGWDGIIGVDCATGLGLRELPVNSSVTFRVPIIREHLKSKTMRVGIHCWPEQNYKYQAEIYWSDAVRVKR
jgi:hypothetical protein